VDLVVVDLIPALLTWESGGGSRVPEGAGEALAEIFSRHRLAAIADGDQTGAGLRRALEDHDLAGFFDSVGTSAGFGPAVSPRIVRRLAAAAGLTAVDTVVVTGRPQLAERLQRHRFGVIITEGPDGFLGVPAALEAMESGGLSR
jgi:hypothetical protein